MDKTKTTSTDQQDWQAIFLREITNNEEAKADLFDILNVLWDLRDSVKSGEFINKLFNKWAMDADLNEYRHEIRALNSSLMVPGKLVALFQCFDNNSGYTKKYKS